MNKKQHAKKCLADPTNPDALKVWETCTCDGYHTFEELYEHRIELFVALCSQLDWLDTELLGRNYYYIWRSQKHSDGTQLEGWFLLGIGREKGKQITYHLPMSKWDETDFAETLDQAPEFDGHTSDDVLFRLKNL